MITGREILNAIIKDKQCPERMGLNEHFWPDTQEYWEQQGQIPKGVDLVEFFDHDLRELDRMNFNTQAFPGADHVVEETDETLVSVNGWGAKLRNWKRKAGTPEHLAFDLTSEEIWRKKYRDPLLALDVKRFGNLDKVRATFAKAKADSRFFVYPNATIFEQMRASMGDVVMLENMYMNPAWILDFCDVMTNHMIMHLEYLLREVGVPDGVWMYEDMGFTKAPFISPEMQREMIMPFHKRLGDFIHSYSIPWIMHSCGKIRSFLPAIQEAGVDCLQVLEAKAGQDVREFAEATGNKMAFMGNLNIMAFETNDKKKLEEEIVPKLKDIKAKRIPFVFHSDHSVPKTVTVDTYKYALELYKKYGRY